MSDENTALILSIDAWRDREGWTWNNHFRCGSVELDGPDAPDLSTPRKVCRFLRDEGYLTPQSAGRVRVDMGGSYEGTFIEIQDRRTGEPLVAISTIHG